MRADPAAKAWVWPWVEYFALRCGGTRRTLRCAPHAVLQLPEETQGIVLITNGSDRPCSTRAEGVCRRLSLLQTPSRVAVRGRPRVFTAGPQATKR